MKFAAKLLPYRAWIILSAVILLSLGVRFRLRDMPLERDEGEYAYAGQLMLQGVPPYKEAYNMKLPGTYAAYAVIMAIFGQTPSGIHIGLALVNAASIALMFFLGRRLLDEITGIVAAVTFGLLSLSPSVLGLAGHATHFVVLPALAGLLFLLRALDPRPASTSPASESVHQPSTIHYQLFFAGFLLGLSFLMKQQGVFFGLCGGLYLVWVKIHARLSRARDRRMPQYKRKNRDQVTAKAESPGQILTQTIIYASGCILPYLITCLILWAAGVFPQFKFWTISYAAQYAAAQPLISTNLLLKSTMSIAVGPSIVLWSLGLFGLILIWWDESISPDRRLFILLLFLCSTASVAVGLYFRGHYFITLLPVLALLNGVAVSRSLRLLKKDQTIELFLAVPLSGLFIIGCLATLIGGGSVWFGMSPKEAVRDIYGSTLFSEAAGVGDFLKNHADSNARIAVIGSEPEIFFYAHRRSASGHIYLYPLMESQAYAQKMQSNMISEIEQRSPNYVVYINDPYSWLRQGDSAKLIDTWWTSYWAKNLDLVLTVAVQRREKDQISNAFAPDSMVPAQDLVGPTGSLLVFKRKP